MPYVGGSVAKFFGAEAQAATTKAAMRLTDVSGDTLRFMVAANTPKKTGKLAGSWRKTPVEAVGRGWMVSVETEVDYAPFVENGTGLYGPKHAKYLIKPKKPGGTLRFVVDGKVVFAKYVWHPGSKGHYMMARALNELEAAIETGIATDLELERWVREVEAQAERQR